MTWKILVIQKLNVEWKFRIPNSLDSAEHRFDSLNKRVLV